jgi:hypothetical protein
MSTLQSLIITVILMHLRTRSIVTAFIDRVNSTRFKDFVLNCREYIKPCLYSSDSSPVEGKRSYRVS